MLWVGRIVSFALVCAMVDVVAGSIHGPTPSLAAIVAATLLAAAAFISLWSRPWTGAATAVLVLFAAFAFSTLPGVTASPAAIGLGTADTAAIVFCIAVVTAGIALWLAIPNAIVRASIVLLAIYELACTATAIGNGGLLAAFGSAPLGWTRGSYVAAEMVFPLAALAALVHAFVLFGRKRGTAGMASFVLAMSLVAAAQFGAYTAGSAGLATIVAFENPSSSGASFASTGTGSGAIFFPKDSGDVSPEVAAAFPGVQKDPQHALASVASMGNDLYPGALGGAIGALRSGSGNSIDKALLLRDVLRSAAPAIQTEFAQCTLADADSDALIAQIRATKTHPQILLQAASGAIASTHDPAIASVLKTWSSTWTSMVTSTQSESTKLASALSTAGVTLPPDAANAARLRAIAANHVWLRANVNGSWVDLDPTIDGSVPGKTRCASQSVAAALPDSDYDVLEVRVTLETSPAKAATVLDRAVRTSDVGDRDVSFMFAEPTGSDAGAMPAIVPSGAAAFTPLLRIGDESVTGTPVVLPQETFGASAGAAAAQAAKGAIGAFDTSASPTPVASATAPPLAIVSALWIDLSVTAPGVDATRVRSPIFDRIGFAARAAKAPVPVLGEEPDAATYRAMQTVWNVAVSGGNVASGGGPATIAPAADAGALSAALARANGAYFSLRRALVDDAAGGVVDVAAARPGISLVAVSNNGGMMIDLASDDAIPLTATETRPLYSSASVTAEREIIDNDTPATTGSAATRFTDALAEFDVDTLTGAKIVGLHPGDTSLDANAAVPADARARISAHLANGASVLAMAPSSAQTGGPPYAFWVSDPATGTLRDENALGRHQEAAEEATTDEPAVQAVPKWKQMACNIVAGIMLAVTQDSGAIEGTSVQAAAAKAAAKTEQQTTCGP